MPNLGRAMDGSWKWHGNATSVPWRCYSSAMVVQCRCRDSHGKAVGLAWHCHGFDMAAGGIGFSAPLHCHGSAFALSYCHGLALALPWHCPDAACAVLPCHCLTAPLPNARGLAKLRISLNSNSSSERITNRRGKKKQFGLYGFWKGLVGCKILPRGVGTICPFFCKKSFFSEKMPYLVISIFFPGRLVILSLELFEFSEIRSFAERF